MASMGGLAHAGLCIRDYDACKDFYTRVLGFEVAWECELEEDDGVTKVMFLRSGDLTIEAFCPQNSGDRVDGLWDHVAIRVTDIEEVQKELEAKGVKFETDAPVFRAEVFANGSKWLMFRGPNGERLELTEVL